MWVGFSGHCLWGARARFLVTGFRFILLLFDPIGRVSPFDQVSQLQEMAKVDNSPRHFRGREWRLFFFFFLHGRGCVG